MYRIKTILILSMCTLLIACGTTPEMDAMNDSVQLTKLSANQAIKQDTSNRTKDILSKYKELDTIHAINSTKSILIGLDVSNFNRFKLKGIRKKIKKAIEKEFPNMDITVSTDKKIILKLNRLEEKTKVSTISKKELNEEINKLIKLAEEQT